MYIYIKEGMYERGWMLLVGFAKPVKPFWFLVKCLFKEVVFIEKVPHILEIAITEFYRYLAIRFSYVIW